MRFLHDLAIGKQFLTVERSTSNTTADGPDGPEPDEQPYDAAAHVQPGHHARRHREQPAGTRSAWHLPCLFIYARPSTLAVSNSASHRTLHPQAALASRVMALHVYCVPK